MHIRTTLTGVAALTFTFVAIGVAQTTVKQIPANQTSAVSGKEMFKEYCAVCHGDDGKSGGPAAVALKKKPADLTQLASHNNGKFPAERVSIYISGADSVAAHGNRDMPIWGEVFKGMAANQDIAKIRVANLTDYVRSLQAK